MVTTYEPELRLALSGDGPGIVLFDWASCILLGVFGRRGELYWCRRSASLILIVFAGDMCCTLDIAEENEATQTRESITLACYDYDDIRFGNGLHSEALGFDCKVHGSAICRMRTKHDSVYTSSTASAKTTELASSTIQS